MYQVGSQPPVNFTSDQPIDVTLPTGTTQITLTTTSGQATPVGVLWADPTVGM
jgi:hypothetical protein